MCQAPAIVTHRPIPLTEVDSMIRVTFTCSIGGGNIFQGVVLNFAYTFMTSLDLDP